MKRVAVAAIVLLLLAAGGAMAKPVTETFEYKAGSLTCQGVFVHDAAAKAKQPGIVLFPDWMGSTEHQREQAERLAALGYATLVADVYGKGVRPKDAGEARTEAGRLYGDIPAMRLRAQAALAALKARPEVDAARLAATGYCFGGRCALELARTGAPLRAVVTFHGSLASANPADAKAIRAKVLVLHGADDPFVKADEVKSFMDEMRAAGADWQVVQYSGAVHSFTDPRAGNDNAKGAAYNAVADRRSWRAMRDFLEETLAAK